jgi:hypothetical protein
MGIAMSKKKEDIHLEIASILSSRTKEGMVEIQINDEKVQMDIAKAKEVCGMLHGAIEAAISDQMIYTFFVEKVQFTDEEASRALLDFREIRQGHKGTVYPN